MSTTNKELTVGELLVGRRLHKTNLGLRPGYLPGQDKGKKYSKTEGLVSYVDPDGRLCIIPVKFIEDEWMPMHCMFRIGLNDAEVRKVPAGSRLRDSAQRAMQERPRPVASQTT